jgi:asparagine synthase (glutamine-hydrolysing)
MTHGRAVYGHPLEADVPVGALLSGGINSALVCWAIRRLGGNVRAFRVSTPGHPGDETEDARLSAQEIGIEHEIIPMDAADQPCLADLVATQGEPFACSSALGMIRVSRAQVARDHTAEGRWRR